MTVPCYLEPARLPVRLQVPYAAGPNIPQALPGQHDAGPLPVQHPEVGAERRARAAVALRPRPARQPRRGEPGPAARRSATSTTSCSAPPTGSAWRAPTCRTRTRSPPRTYFLGVAQGKEGVHRTATTRTCSPSSPTCRASARWPTACSRGCSTSCTWAGRWCTRPASTPTRPSRWAGRGVIDTTPAVLRRQQPGRHHRRRAHRARARLRPRRARRAGHELLHAAPPLERLGHRAAAGQRRPARVLVVHVHALPERARAAADPLADPDAVGPRRGQRLRATT